MPDLGPRKGMSAEEIEAAVAAILTEATLAEKVAMMSGRGFFAQYAASGRRWGADPYRAGGGCERLGVPALYFTDGPRGVARGSSTCFPCTMARGATFDVDLERRIGEIMGMEARAQGCNLSGAVCINLLRHPAWGRAQETYGEDSHHLGAMGAALAQGIQTHNVIATVKHFALNSMENARFKVDVACDERTLREVFLPHFRAVIEAGCASVMSAYNKVNGEFCGQNADLLTGILRHEWGFDGFVHSDWIRGVRKPYGAAAGLDIENPEPRVFGDNLIAAVEAGSLDPRVIDTACRRILTVLYRFACAEDPLERYPETLVACPAHVATALEAAEKSAVLLKNDGVLPFDRTRVAKLAVLGKLADRENTGDHGSSRVQPPFVVTPLAGLRAMLGEDAVVFADGEDEGATGAAIAACDAVVVVAGYTAAEEGEFIPGDLDFGQAGATAAAPSGAPPRPSLGGDRTSLSLPADQIALIQRAAAAGKPLAVVIQAGSAVMVEEWLADAGAVLQTFYAGMHTGTALARLLFGAVSPSGKLPFTVARDAGDYPFFDKDADRIVYGPLAGYALFEDTGAAPRFGFGHGLSYARFAYRGLTVRRAARGLEVSVSIHNLSAIGADEVAFFFVGPPGREAPRARKQLRAFVRIHAPPGDTVTARAFIPDRDLTWWCPHTRSWRLEAGEHAVFAGGASDEAALLRTTIRL